MARLKITEIFHSIQGESTLSGERFSFVRLTGCPLRCTYCDTTYSYTGGKWMEVEEIVAEVLSHGTRWVCITGGEPLVQKDCLQLVHALRAKDLKITIETDGEEDVAPYAGLARLIMDVKTPSSGEIAERAFANFAILDDCSAAARSAAASNEIKFVIGNREDYEWAKKIANEYRLTQRFTVLFSPVFGENRLREVAEWIIADKLDVRLQTQLHKHVWGAATTGV